MRHVSLLGSLFLLFSLNAAAVTDCPQEKKAGRLIAVTPNRLAPELYSEKLTLRITLMNLPGANEPRSQWQGEYKVYFVAEREFEKIMRQLKREGRDRELTPELFPQKVLLAQGSFAKNGLKTLSERTFIVKGIDFKRKIPTDQQTSFATIMSFYSIKVYDAKLGKTIYDSGVFFSPPFEVQGNDQRSMAPLSTIYLNFYVSEDGDIYKSSRKEDSGREVWGMTR
jgi:hypothetical protein